MYVFVFESPPFMDTQVIKIMHNKVFGFIKYLLFMLNECSVVQRCITSLLFMQLEAIIVKSLLREVKKQIYGKHFIHLSAELLHNLSKFD